jgi:pimeloyl-ACP methyl ester carboxylesterase
MFKRALLVLAVSMAFSVMVPVFAQDETSRSGYALIDGLEMYYEIHGQGDPLVILHGGYMSILTMGEIVPRLAQTRQIVIPEMQGHGRTADIDRPLSYEQMADDTVALMEELGIEQADIFGYSMGSGIALEMATRYPQRIDKLVLASPAYNADAYYPGFFEMVGAITPELFAGTPIIEDYTRLAPNPENFPVLVEKLVQLDSKAPNWTAEDIQSIESPTLIIIGDSDSVRPEHAVDMFRLRGGGVDGELAGLPNAQLAILPATTHISVLFRVDWLESMITSFLDAPVAQ